ncbi:MAG TPA: hypothetical protein VNJ01_05305 [Bacteriovoracaceae bacterium]|nr:hypothetical protein [Bacteriovoracaceae bacterium]
MSNQKKDLTSIDDLGEFIHELSEDNETRSSFETGDLGLGEDSTPESSFGSDDQDQTFGDTEAEDDHSPPDFSSKFDLDPEEDLETTAFDDDDYTPDLSPRELTKTEIPKPLYDSERATDYELNPPESFSELKTFAESSSFSQSTSEANPSFSVLIRDVRFIEDVNDIVIILKELNLVTDSEEVMKGRLMRGSLLVPRISEFAAIFLAHKLRRFDIDLQLGLSDEIHPPKHKEKPETGIVSKFNLHQNHGHHFHFDDPKLEISQIIVAATPSLEGHQVIRYLGVASEHKFLSAAVVENEGSDEVPRYYQELAQKLKAHALKAHANAVVGLNYQLTPLPSELGSSGHKYRLTCTGNLVWVNKL